MAINKINTVWTVPFSSSDTTLLTEGKFLDANIKIQGPELANFSFSEEDFSGTNIEYSSTNVSGIISSSGGKLTVSSEGWISEGEYSNSETSSKYVKGVTLSDSKQFEIHDGIWDWTWQKDENGNVYIY